MPPTSITRTLFGREPRRDALPIGNFNAAAARRRDVGRAILATPDLALILLFTSVLADHLRYRSRFEQLPNDVQPIEAGQSFEGYSHPFSKCRQRFIGLCGRDLSPKVNGHLNRCILIGC